MIRPLFGNVLLRPIKEEEKAGIYLKQSADAPQRGEVIAVGGGEYVPVPYAQVIQKINCVSSSHFDCTHRATERKEGLLTIPILVHKKDRVLFPLQSASEVFVNQEKHYIINQQDILGVEF